MRMLLTLAAYALLLCACHPSSADPPDTLAATDFLYAEAGIEQLQTAMARGETSSRQLVEAYLQRIEALDSSGPRLNAILEHNPHARTEADALDAERRAGRLRGPLHGIPLVLKDTIDATPMATSAGSLALAEFRPQQDAFLVRRLREAGAVILGKANLSEWAGLRSSRAIPGWSSRGGQTRNPYALDRSACGSSAGTAVAVAANLATAGIGTGTDAGILCPAAINGIVGFRPTVGLVSRDGILPLSHSLDSAGPMARSVADAALLLAVIAGRDSADPATADNSSLLAPDYAARLRPDALRGVRIGLLRDANADAPELATATTQAVAALRNAGAIVVEADLPTAGQWEQDVHEVLLFEFKAGLERYLRQREAPVTSLHALIDYNRRHAARTMPQFGQDLLEEAAARGGLNDPGYIAARMRARRLAGPEGIDAALRAQRLDALIAPTTSAAWRMETEQSDRLPAARHGAAAAGYPVLTVPMGHADGLPLGLSFIGTAWSDARVLQYGHAYEQLTRARHPPTLPASH